MRNDAFNDVTSPFDYKAELAKARSALNAKIVEYVLGHPTESYRDLAEKFNMSPAKLCAIGKRNRVRKPGRPRGRKVKFGVRQKEHAKGGDRWITVFTRNRGVSVGMMRQLIIGYFPETNVSVSRIANSELHDEWDYDQIEALKARIIYKSKVKGIEADLRTLAGCTTVDNTGDIAYEAVARWLEGARRRKDGLYDWAQRLVARYSEFRNG